MKLTYKLYAYCESPATDPRDDKMLNEVEVDYPEAFGAFHLGRTLAKAGWRVLVTEEDQESGTTLAQFAGPDFLREEKPHGESLRDA